LAPQVFPFFVGLPSDILFSAMSNDEFPYFFDIVQWTGRVRGDWFSGSPQELAEALGTARTAGPAMTARSNTLHTSQDNQTD
jgi:hypothetical protein